MNAARYVNAAFGPALALLAACTINPVTGNRDCATLDRHCDVIWVIRGGDGPVPVVRAVVRDPAGPGRPRRYCRRSCRQRDYESRRRTAELGLGEHELIMTRHELDELRDKLYVLAETVKDVETDLSDDDADDERRLLNVLLYAAKQATE